MRYTERDRVGGLASRVRDRVWGEDEGSVKIRHYHDELKILALHLSNSSKLHSRIHNMTAATAIRATVEARGTAVEIVFFQR